MTGYRYSGTTYASLAALNAALAGASIAQAGTITIKVVYDVASNKGGVNTVYTLTAASRRTPATSGNAASSITPSQTYAVAVTPDGGQNVQRLPGNNYSFTLHRAEQRQRERRLRSAGVEPGVRGDHHRVGERRCR